MQSRERRKKGREPRWSEGMCKAGKEGRKEGSRDGVKECAKQGKKEERKGAEME